MRLIDESLSALVSDENVTNILRNRIDLSNIRLDLK